MKISDEYWEMIGKVSAAVCMHTAQYRESLFTLTACPRKIQNDIIGRVQLKR